MIEKSRIEDTTARLHGAAGVSYHDSASNKLPASLELRSSYKSTYSVSD